MKTQQAIRARLVGVNKTTQLTKCDQQADHFVDANKMADCEQPPRDEP
jgi:hypothetical protein